MLRGHRDVAAQATRLVLESLTTASGGCTVPAIYAQTHGMFGV